MKLILMNIYLLILKASIKPHYRILKSQMISNKVLQRAAESCKKKRNSGDNLGKKRIIPVPCTRIEPENFKNPFECNNKLIKAMKKGGSSSICIHELFKEKNLQK